VSHTSLLAVMLLALANSSFSQDTVRYVPNGTEGEVIPTLDARNKNNKPDKKQWNTFNLGFTTLTLGGGFLLDYAGYLQNDNGNKQMDSANVELNPGFFVRDTRIMVSGKFKTKRAITWKAGFMYDGQLDAWFLRETGIMVAVPELWGHFFVGRTKEGFSQSKVQVGYAGELIERHLALDPIPILADGVKWLGFLPKQHVFWNIGVYTDWISKNESFSTYKSQFVARIGWLPIYSEPSKTNLHVAFNIRLAHPDDDNIRLRSRPEVGTRAPYFIDTGEFPTTKSTHLGGELYYSSAPWFFGAEYYWHKFNSPERNNPVFSGGELVAGYMFTGESHPYNAVSSIYGFVQVNKSVFKGGQGAWEALLRFSTFDLNDAVIQGGKFWRISPQVNWYLSQNVRFELMYGYGVLDRFNIKGVTQFFQSRLQLSF
jgi:phosphate-selective porin OprO/OprP